MNANGLEALSRQISMAAHLQECVERYGMLETFINQFEGRTHDELHVLLREVFRCVLDDLPSSEVAGVCSRESFFNSHIRAFLNDWDIDISSLKPTQPRDKTSKRVVNLSPYSNRVLTRFLYGHAASSLATIVLTRIQINVISDPQSKESGCELEGHFLKSDPDSCFSIPEDFDFTSLAAVRCSASSQLKDTSPSFVHPLVASSCLSPAYKAICKMEAEIASRVPLGVVISPDGNKVEIKLPSVCMNTFLHTNRQMLCCSFNPAGATVAAGFGDSSVHCWNINDDPSTANPLHEGIEMHGHSAPVYGTSFNSDGRWLVTASSDGNARLWSAETGQCVTKYENKSVYEPLWNVCFCPSDGYFATGSHDRTARIWSATSNLGAARIFVGHSGDVTSIQFHPNTAVLATGSTDNTVRLWDIASGGCISVLKHSSPITCLAFHPTGQYLAVGMANGEAALWDLNKSSPAFVYSPSDGKSPVLSASFSADGNLLATGEANCCVRLWDSSTESVARCSEGDTRIKKMMLLKTLYTKSTPVMALLFTRMNLLLAAGPYHDNSAESYLSKSKDAT